MVAVGVLTMNLNFIAHHQPINVAVASLGGGISKALHLETRSPSTYSLLFYQLNPTFSFHHSCCLSNSSLLASFVFSSTRSAHFLTGGKALFAAPEVGLSTETSEWALQDFYALRRNVEITLVRVEEIVAAAGLKQLEEDLMKLEKAAADSSLWDDRAKAQQTLQALTDVREKMKLLDDFKAQIRQWKHWEDSVANENYDTQQALKSKITNVQQHDFIRNRFLGLGKQSTILGWLHAFYKQFYGSVTKTDYVALRLGFIMTHCKGNPKFNFHKYMIRTLEDDFKTVVGISWYLWIFVVLFLLLNINDKQWWNQNLQKNHCNYFHRHQPQALPPLIAPA